MDFQITTSTVVVTDLDDTLYKEIDFVTSGFRAVGEHLRSVSGNDPFDFMWRRFQEKSRTVFDDVIQEYGLKGLLKDDLIEIYRTHLPNINLPEESRRFLDYCREHAAALGVITDGYAVTQRNKMAALGIAEYFDEIVISEEFGSAKPSRENYLHFERRFADRSYVYVGENPKKDFVTPNTIGWTTIALRDDGRNIHGVPPDLDQKFFAQLSVDNLAELCP